MRRPATGRTPHPNASTDTTAAAAAAPTAFHCGCNNPHAAVIVSGTRRIGCVDGVGVVASSQYVTTADRATAMAARQTGDFAWAGAATTAWHNSEASEEV